MLAVLGDIPKEFPTVELSSRASDEEAERWMRDRLVIFDSDAHTADDISSRGEIELEEYSVAALVERLRRGGAEA